MDESEVTKVATCMWDGVGSALEYEGVAAGCCLIHSRTLAILWRACSPKGKILGEPRMTGVRVVQAYQ